ncbi:lipoyl synthase [Salinarchaeum sp. Harcht-Bsk1]|uniref:lipoyl synthase n=1 Tax=Salinarchaeum sp. Harcht-Bsk1 TaxID=1333523 RepID=UPI00034238C7|nr:lipoyl synthase [Salinarchaeum sp. Harcht-Bsk1]AGN01831.1 lipoyl synthase [Salinarchaeum sp. Harcht-Bsk1]
MSRSRKPEWLRSRIPTGEEFTRVKATLREHDLTTVCEEANCPNLGECWSGAEGGGPAAASGNAAAPGVEGNRGGTATFMLLGDQCTRNCGFCDVDTGGGQPLDPDEPENVASAVAEIGLEYVVLTSVDRDDLEGQGAAHFAETIRELKRRDPGVLVEVLIPDFQGDPDLVGEIVDAGPDVIAHNVETVERLQERVRDPRAGYEQSLSVLEQVASESGAHAKTSIMLGHGEHDHEVYQALSDCREAGVDVITLGQYLRPSRDHLPVREYVHPHVFDTWRDVAEQELGFLYCASGPMVRSSYRAGELFVEALQREDATLAEARRAARNRS